MVRRRLKWLLLLVLIAGLADLWVQARLRPAGTPGPFVRLSHGWTNLWAPRTPPHEFPPGRPFAAAPVTYSGGIPTEAELRQRLRGTNVLICVLDAARADHFGAYGYPRDTTPNFDRLAKESLLFEQHYCEVPETKPSTVSLLSGLSSEVHGQTSNITPGSMEEGKAAPFPTLESTLQKAGFSTYLLTSSPAPSPEFGIAGDFEHRRYPQQRWTPSEDPIVEMQQGLREFLPRWKASDRPFFAYFHVFPPHAPYDRIPAEFRRPFEGRRPPRYWRASPALAEEVDDKQPQEPDDWVEWSNRYDANLRRADSFLGDLERALREAGLLERTLLIVTADHGEGLREHGHAFHSSCPYDEALHIPLLVRFPGAHKPVGRVGALTQTMDLFPTVLAWYRPPVPSLPPPGQSLSPLLTGKAQQAHSYLFSRTLAGAPCYVVHSSQAALLLYFGGKYRAYYDLDKDPWETRNRYRESKTQAASLEQAFAAFAGSLSPPPRGFLEAGVAPAPPKPSGKLTEEQKKTLRSLGYMK